ncbi:MAG: SH3 domain-containing protein [Pleurocapsa minor GSE-CHR-MK-17-07R]|jgi:hypothetical protein|nr:SH3 domain-containing protein [Pleurocapsa minor GSE-CHR-MK 17-07R]
MLRRFALILLAGLLMLSMVGGLAAQTIGVLTPGGGQIGSLSAQVPIALYTFQGNQGDLAQITLVGLQPGMTLTASLQDQFQQPVAASVPDATPGSASLNALLPNTGVFSVLVGGTAGDFVISLSTVATTGAPQLPTDSQQIVNIAGAQPVLASFASTSASSLSVTMSASAGLRYAATLYDGRGQVVGTASSAPQACFAVSAGDSLYRLLATGLSPEVAGTLTLTFGTSCANGAGVPAVPVAPVQPVAPSQPAVQPTVCTAYSVGSVNIRAGAGTDFAILGQLSEGNGLPVTGVTNDGWLQVQTSSGTGYVFQSLVTLGGPCGAIPQVSAPQPPAGATQPPVQLITATPPAGPTLTYTPTALADLAPTQAQATQAPPTATYTNTVAAPVAPPDSNYVLVVPLDSSANLSDYVSFPDGDVEDVISYDTSGLNANSALPGGRGRLTIALSCFGTGTQNITFRIDGQNYACGQTFFRDVNADSDTGAVRVIASGPAYVQWVLSATLPRL